jgi:hypothetical protein
MPPSAHMEYLEKLHNLKMVFFFGNLFYNAFSVTRLYSVDDRVKVNNDE